LSARLAVAGPTIGGLTDDHKLPTASTPPPDDLLKKHRRGVKLAFPSLATVSRRGSSSADDQRLFFSTQVLERTQQLGSCLRERLYEY